MKRRELLNHLTSLGEEIYGRREAMQIARMILEEVGGVGRTELLLHPDEECPIKNLELIEQQIKEGRPIQYIIGEADFCDFRLSVREGCLIPRPESEELVSWIVSECDRGAKILDVGVGSGALSIALSRMVEGSDVTGLDISDEAIAIATENRDRLAPKVKIIKGDALRGVENYVEHGFDLILSNPPYIPQSEITQMRINVTRYEPHLALFVADDDPLIFYRTIARSALKLLKPKGRLYFEIHENYADEMLQMLTSEGFGDIRTRLDINDKPRMICAQRE